MNLYNVVEITILNNMERKYIYVVEECLIKTDGTQESLGHYYFSTYEKEVAYIGWLRKCVENNNGVLLHDNFFMSRYKLPNGEEYMITGNRRLLDGAEIGEA